MDGAINESDLKQYKTWLTSVDPWQRDIALHVLMHCFIKDDEVDDLVAQILRTDNDIKIRRAAIHFIASRQDRKFLPFLLESLHDEDWCVKGNALLAIKQIEPEWEEIPEVRTFIQQETHPFVCFCINNNDVSNKE